MKDDIAIVIPAYNPNKKLQKEVEELVSNKYTNIIIINDGSTQKEIFENIRNQGIIIEHEKNKGKGQALKTGFEYCINNFRNIIGIITVDADGQHTVEDVNKIYMTLKENEQDLILGSRNFKEKNVPYRSKLGNKIISNIVNQRTKHRIVDTQTGLRAIPIKYIEEIKMLEGNGFEYEMNVILYALNKKIKIKEVRINTIYENKNEISHFRPIIDSLKICKMVYYKTKIKRERASEK